eukprot:358273-Chlamydomonas_euryale.AAC.2
MRAVRAAVDVGRGAASARADWRGDALGEWGNALSCVAWVRAALPGFSPAPPPPHTHTLGSWQNGYKYSSTFGCVPPRLGAALPGFSSPPSPHTLTHIRIVGQTNTQIQTFSSVWVCAGLA